MTPDRLLAAIIEQRKCQHPGCDVLGYLCHAHHDVLPWGKGGHTHARVHDPGTDPTRT